MAGLLANSGKANPATSSSSNPLDSFNYQGIRLGDSVWQRQYQAARDYYLAVSNDDILKGFRAASGKPAPGQTLGGWCERDSSTVFGQWLSGMSRIYRATGDTQIRGKAIYLFDEWSKTIGPDGDARMRHYPYEKLVCGLVDLKLYAGNDEAIEMLAKVTDHASRTFNRDRIPASPKPWEMHSGRPLEWYTLPENLYRAYQVSGEKQFKDFADV